MEIRTDKHGILRPPLRPLVSKHRSYKVAIRTAGRRARQAGVPMAVVAWHDADYVVMPASIGQTYDDEDLFVEFIPAEGPGTLRSWIERITKFFQ